MKEKILFSIIINCFLLCGFSQDKGLIDSVSYVHFVDQINKTPLSYTIVLKKGKVIAISDEDGVIDVSLIKCDSSDLLISRYGYKKQFISCNDLKNKRHIKLTPEDNFLNTVEVTSLDNEKALKQDKRQSYLAQYYFKLKIFDNKHKQIFISDMIVNIYDTGKNKKFPYKLQFVSKRLSKLKSKQFHFNDNKTNIETEVAVLIWQNKSRIKDNYKDNRYKIRTKTINDTTLVFFHRKNDTYITNNAHIWVFNNTVCYFDSEFIMRENLIETYKARYESKSKKDKSFLPISKSFFYYIYNTIKFSDTEKYISIPSNYKSHGKIDQLSHSKRIKYNTFYIEKTMILIKDLDLSLAKKINFSKGKFLKYEPLDTLPSTHPYFDTIPFPK